MYVLNILYPLFYHGNLGCFHLLTILNKVPMNMGVQKLRSYFLSIWEGVLF